MSREAGNHKIDLNRAGTRVLATIPGVGETLAARIVRFRDERGGFRGFEELMEIAGVGSALLNDLRSYCSLDGEERPPPSSTPDGAIG